jgi:hypothetical protein
MSVATKALIANGTAISGPIDLRGQILTAIAYPAAWTAADLSIQIGDTETGTFYEVFTDPGTGVGTVGAWDAAAGQATMVSQMIANCFIKLRSGPVGAPVNQGADRTITLFTVPI